MSWLGFAYPCLLIAYIGQAAYISSNTGAFSNPFFNSVPPGMFYPSLVIAILAAVVASQTMITATFQLLSQIIKLSYFPQIRVIHTSDKFHNQIYIPWVNWLLMIGTICVTAAYSNTTKLGEVCKSFMGVILLFVLAFWILHMRERRCGVSINMRRDSRADSCRLLGLWCLRHLGHLHHNLHGIPCRVGRLAALHLPRCRGIPCLQSAGWALSFLGPHQSTRRGLVHPPPSSPPLQHLRSMALWQREPVAR